MAEHSVNAVRSSSSSEQEQSAAKPVKTESDTFDEVADKSISDEETEDLFNKNTESFRCLAQILISRSSLLRHPLYHFPPLEDPGLDEAFNYIEPPLVIDNIGREYYLQQCKDLQIVPISRVLKSLSTDTLDLTYYGLTEKQVRAIMKTLQINEFIHNVILQDNWLTPQAVVYISRMFEDNNVLSHLSLRECRIKPEGAFNLNEGLLSTIHLQELDLSFNSLGDEGMYMLEPGLLDNTSISKLNLSHNDLGEEAAKILTNIILVNNYLETLDLSWNNFYSGPGNKIFFAALVDSKIKILNLAWNGIGTREAALPISKYLKSTEKLEHFDISNNRLTGTSLKLIRGGIAKCTSLITVKIGNNLIRPDEALTVLRLLLAGTCQLEELDMENTFVNKDFIPIWKRLVAKGKRIKIGGILSNYTIRGPDTVKLLFDRAKFLAMKAKKKKAQKDFGHFILQMPAQGVAKQEFQTLVKKFKMKKVDKDLVEALMNKFIGKKQQIDLVAMRESYMSYYPDTCLPPPKPKKGKGKKGKKVKEKPPPAEAPDGQPPSDGTPQAEGLPLTGQPPVEGQPVGGEPATVEQPSANEQPPTEGEPPAEEQSLTNEQQPAEGESLVEQSPAEEQGEHEDKKEATMEQPNTEQAELVSEG